MTDNIDDVRKEAEDIMGHMLAFLGQFTNIRLAELICIENGYSFDEVPIMAENLDKVRSRASRFMSNKQYDTCSVCEGVGWVTPHPLLSLATVCEECHGKGHIGGNQVVKQD